MGFWEITKKDLRLLVRDKRTTALLIILPLVFITIIGLTTGKLLGWKRSNQLLRIGFLDEVDYDAVENPGNIANAALDAAEQKRARNLVTKIVNGLQEGRGIEILPAKDRRMLQQMMDGQVTEEINAGLIFGPDFYQRVNELDAGDLLSPSKGRLKDGFKALDMQLISDEPDSTTHTIIDRLVMVETMGGIGPSVFCRSGVLRGRITETCNELDAEGENPLIELLPPEEERPASDDRMYNELVPGWTVMFVFFLVNIMARSFIHERDLGTLRRLRIAPVPPTGVMFGKTLPFFIISLVQTSLLFLTGRFLFGMSWGVEPWLLIPIIVSTSMAATTLGLMVATLVKTDAQVSAYANFVVIVMAGISGCFLPRDWLPDYMRTISLATPHAWALMGYREVLTTANPQLGEILKSCGMMLGFSVIYFGIGAFRFRHVE
jgi:ABC-2 type transport system permease protein